jgi:hypothetical protein
MDRYLVGMVRTDKIDFTNTIDLGVPIDDPSSNIRTGKREKDVLVLYQKESSLPNNYHSKKESLPEVSSSDAIENCDYLNVILTDHSGRRNQCWAMLPQYESYHVQKWMRVKPGKSKLDKKLPLTMVSRGMKDNGLNDFDPPMPKHINHGIDMLQNYFKNLDESVKLLKPMVEKVATPNKTVIVMVVNFGQSELLVNHVCAARSRKLDISSILVFATDVESKELAESLGLTVFYDEPVGGCELDITILNTYAISHFFLSIDRTLGKCPKKLPGNTGIANLLP